MNMLTGSRDSVYVAEPCPMPKRATILSIDDDPDISMAIECRFRPFGIEVLRAFHGEQGIWLATTEKPDLIITDLVMPRSSGDNVIECLKSTPETRHIPIVVLTGQSNGYMRRQVRNLGADAYLTKPIQFQELQQVVESLVVIRTE